MGELLTFRNVWAAGLVLLCKASFDSFDLNGGFSFGVGELAHVRRNPDVRFRYVDLEST